MCEINLSYLYFPMVTILDRNEIIHVMQCTLIGQYL